MRIDGPRGLVPDDADCRSNRYRRPRLALVGEAAHVFPPIGAQGLNLGFRDVAALRDAVVDARRRGHDPGSHETLARYQRGRDLDVRLRTAAVDGLNRTLLTGMLPADFLRGAGLLALSHIGPLRRIVMREGVLPRIGVPRLMQGAASSSQGKEIVRQGAGLDEVENPGQRHHRGQRPDEDAGGGALDARHCTGSR